MPNGEKFKREIRWTGSSFTWHKDYVKKQLRFEVHECHTKKRCDENKGNISIWLGEIVWVSAY